LSRSTKSWALIVGLQPGTVYYVKVMAYNSAGEGPESERYIGKILVQAYIIYYLYAPYHLKLILTYTNYITLYCTNIKKNL